MTNTVVDSCPLSLYDTSPQASYCLPQGEDVVEAMEAIYKQLDEKYGFGSYIADLQRCWKAIAVMCFMTFVISIVYLGLLKWITKPLLYVSMLLILVGFILLGFFS